MTQLTALAEWQALQHHQIHIAEQTMQSWFAQDPLRFNRFSLQLNGILLDYSKNQITKETLDLLFKFADRLNIENKIADLFTDNILNTSENRAALHTALRNPSSEPIFINKQNVMPDIHATLKKMHEVSDQIRNQKWLGATNKPIRHIVNIGIGGSHLGPLMVTYALQNYATDQLHCYFVSNIDSAHLFDLFKKIDPETTLFIISSKTFSTLETLTNARTIRQWMVEKVGETHLSRHFVAVTANPEKAIEFGIPAEQIFHLWEWVGGRYSVWSAIGLPLAIMIGMDNFLEFLKGAHEMDEHFRNAEFSKNMPVMMALIGIWYINFFGAESHAIVPYAHQLNYFRAHLQQLDMESNGKHVTNRNILANYATGPIIWGEQGCNGQHAFHQLLHQGQHFVPVDFIIVGENNHVLKNHHDILIASGLSQAQALMEGKTVEQAFNELIAEGYTEQDAKRLAPHKSIPGNRPSNILFIDKLTPRNLGALVALYEHKIFVQGIIWDINSFDQWGVELGKQLLPMILTHLKNPESTVQLDASTLGLIRHYRNLHTEKSS